MEKFIITGGRPLRGEVTIGGAKNAAVAIIPAAILSSSVCRIENIPNISDVTTISQILCDIGARVNLINKNTLEIDCSRLSLPITVGETAGKIRASSYLMGALLGRFKNACVPLPGGCNFDVRPIDQHLKGFAALGASHKLEGGKVCLKAEELIGNSVYLDIVSVGATINLILAATLAKGTTVIENAAKEPHIVDLANFLNSMGADITGAGTDSIRINGVEKLGSTTYSIIPDQIEAGTYMAAAVATGGDILVKNITPKHLESMEAKFSEMGAVIQNFDDSLRISHTGRIKKCNVKTMPHPGFPTDMQPQITTLLCTADGTSIVTESVWDSRFKYVEELGKMGAKISVDGKLAIVEGVESLKPSPVKATDLRAGAALLIAALSANGTSSIEDIDHIERGYENIIFKLKSLGANIKKVNFPNSTAIPSAL